MVWAALAGLLGCRSDASALCTDFLRCADANASWGAFGAVERVGPEGTCWDEGEDVCLAECSRAYAVLPAHVQAACPLNWASYGLLDRDALNEGFKNGYCEVHEECAAGTCQFQTDVLEIFPLEDCRLDAVTALGCLDEGWYCDGQPGSGLVIISHLCWDACL